MADIVGSLKIFSHSPRICKFNNGTNICDKGYKLNTPGICFSQSLGKQNSTGFEPSFPICLVDYRSFLDSNNTILSVGAVFSINSGVLKDLDYGVLEGSSFPIVKIGDGLQKFTTQLQVSNDLTGNFGRIYAEYLVRDFTVDTLVSSVGTDGSFVLHHAGKNIVPHIRDRTSEYWVVDTYSTSTVVKQYPSLLKTSKIYGSTVIAGTVSEISTDTSVSGIKTPYQKLDRDFSLPQGYTLIQGTVADNPVSICSDDIVAPVVSGTDPVRGSHLNPVTSAVSFSVIDAVAGVDLGLLSVTVSGNITSQPEGRVVVTSGTDVTSGLVSIIGDQNQYIVTYTPSLSWGYNEIVTVTVSGQDLVPYRGNDLWSCFDPDIRNVFGDSYSFKILNESEFPTLITGLPDTDPPYISNAFPGMYTRDNDVNTYVEFDIIDDATGVDLSSLGISVAGVEIVSAGAVITSETSIVLIEGGFRVRYTPVSSFSYTGSVEVIVSVSDSYNVPNSTILSYYFSTVGSGTLVVENFDPAENSSHLAETKDISVDVYDTAFGLLDAYLIINGVTYSGTRVPLYGNISMTTTVSGLTSFEDTTFSGTTISGATVSGVDIFGDLAIGGHIIVATAYSGTAYNFTAPYNTVSGTIISAVVTDGTLVSGTVLDTLVSGINWDGNISDATISGVSIINTYGTGISNTDTLLNTQLGWSITVHPDNDYLYSGAINIFVRGQNNNTLSPVVKNDLYRLYYGYRVIKHKYEFLPAKKISISARAINEEVLQNALSDIYQVTTYSLPSKDLMVSIVGEVPWRDLSAGMTIHSPTHSYGETIDVEFYIKDYDGNVFGPYTFYYTIEDE